MSVLKNISYKNIVRRPGRSFILILLSAMLCFLVTGGSLAITGLKGGLLSLKSRLGADIMVVPYEATTKTDFSNMILQGNPGYFYMNRNVLDKIKNIEGIKEISEQYFLASAKAGCCSAKLQLIGFDPKTDFTIRPWVKESYAGDLGQFEILVGNDLNAFAGDELTFYNKCCTVKGKLKKTGTYLDTAVYMSIDSIKALLKSAEESGMVKAVKGNPDTLTSCILINVANGHTPLEVMTEINIKTRGVEAIQTKDMISGVAGQLESASKIIGFLIVAIWLLSIFILVLAFTMIANERKKEFAILRVLGSSRKMVAGVILKEAVIVSFVGSIIGAVIAVIAVLLSSNVSLTNFDLPFLVPDISEIFIISVGMVVVSVIAGCLASSLSAFKTSKIDTALILREGN
ncbi:MAG: ABC transporter permease [Catonella sp.]|uniref:ABC transporter permease n=1 Tax=Catonella sp. TaxID=2382125 RepID=UPI003FA03118